MMMESPAGNPDSPMEQDDAAYPCKGCGEILEEGKAFELAGNRWHIDCFRCNTCSTLLDSDANLLLLGDGSLICNNCTYSCSACGNKIEDLAILTGDQAFCATCFKCRNCKKKIENLKYARTSQGIFCMECHESLMQRRRKKATKGGGSRHKLHQQQQQQQQQQMQPQNSTMLLDKSLPSLPPNAVPQPFSPDIESPLDSYSDTPTELPSMSQKGHSDSRASSYSGLPTESSRPLQKRPPNPRSESSKSARREKSPLGRSDDRKGELPGQCLPSCGELTVRENLTLPSTTYKRQSVVSQRSDDSATGENFFIALDPNPAPGPSPLVMKPTTDPLTENVKPHANENPGNLSDYFSTNSSKPTMRKVSQDQGIPYASPPGSPRESRLSSGPSSPHIAYQEIGRDLNLESPDYVRKRRDNSISGAITQRKTSDITNEPSPQQNGESQSSKFMLGDVPKNKRVGHSSNNSRSDTNSPAANTLLAASKSRSTSSSANVHVKDQQVVSPPTGSPASARIDQDIDGSSQTTQDSRSHENNSIGSSTSHSSPVTTQYRLPQRNDSLQKSTGSRAGGAPGRKDDNAAVSKLSIKMIKDGALQNKPSSAPATTTFEHPSTTLPSSNGYRGSVRPIDSPSSFGNNEIPNLPPRARDRLIPVPVTNSEHFTTPKETPQAAGSYLKTRKESVSTIRSEFSRNEDVPVSPKLPRHVGGGDLSMDDDVARMLSNEFHQEPSFLRRVSNSVRHGRSYSDRGTRLSKEHKWPKSPLVGSSFPTEVSSSTSTSPDTRDEISWLKGELRREQQRNAEKEEKLLEVETALEAKSNIQQMNTELKTKRSTMVMLDTQKEIVVRELEILTEHIANTKKSSDPLDFGDMSNTVVRQFGESLQKLKDSYAPEIEDLAQQKLELKDDVANLSRLKDKSFTEFEQLSLKNAQLAELNNQLVHQIQELYKANAGPHLDIVKPPLNGLGIYTNHQNVRSTASIDGLQRGPPLVDGNYSGSTMAEPDAENATYLNAPQVVNIKRAQPKKFNWKKGGHNVAKGVTKGLKGAFTSNDAKAPREGQYTEGMPYGSIPPNQEYSLGSVPKSQIHDPSRQGFGFFGTQKKPNPHQQWRAQPVNGSAPTSNDGIPALFGSELELRTEYERSGIPGIVQRCIEEVETRGMDIEGIYRKSGGNSQILQIKEGFERSNDYDISDPDLDINAVTSTLKQYFRKLPTPLITFPVYDLLLNSVSIPQDPNNPHLNLNPPPQRPPAETISLMRSAILELPARHRDTLEFLIFHLARVVEREKDNLMTSLNVAVVFAPTVMRPESLKREMQESQEKNRAVQFLIENCQAVFLSDAGERLGRD